MLALSIGLMMGSLMLAISIIGALSATFREGKATPIVGWLTTFLLSEMLGVAVGFAVLVLGQSGMAALPLKLGGIVGAFVLWKLRESFAPPAINAHYVQPGTQEIAPPQEQRVAISPQRGTLLDRLVPVLVLGIIALFAARGKFSLNLPTTPAIAAPNSQTDAR